MRACGEIRLVSQVIFLNFGPIRQKQNVISWKCVPFDIHICLQGRRRVLKSGPAEDMVECPRLERGRAREGARGDLPRENFDKLVPLNAFWGQSFDRFC